MIAPIVERRSPQRIAQDAAAARELADLMDQIERMANTPVPTFESELKAVWEELK